MVNDIIQEVKRAELHAVQVEKDAKAGEEKMIKQALEEARNLVSMAIKRAKEKNVKDMEIMEKEEELLIQKIMQGAEEEIFQLRETEKKKEQGAIQLVLKEVI